MNRRNFIKFLASAISLPLVAAKVEINKEEAPMLEKSLPYYVTCHVKKQQEWIFTDKFKTLSPEKEFFFGKMIDGKLRFSTLDSAIVFVEAHLKLEMARQEFEDIVYDIFYLENAEKVTEVSQKESESPRNITQAVGHMWYNAKTGRNIYWRVNKPYEKK